MVDHLDCLVSAAALILFDQESPSPLTCLNFCVLLQHRDSRFFLLSRRVTIGGLRIDLHERLKRSARMHFDSLSLLKVESTVCFQRKRRRERAVTRERYVSFAAKNLESLPSLRERHDTPCFFLVTNYYNKTSNMQHF